MTDDKVAGEGPYKHGCTLTGKYLCPACIYADGRKAGEKEFKELLEVAEDLYVGCEHHLARCSFVDWKKARGIE